MGHYTSIESLEKIEGKQPVDKHDNQGELCILDFSLRRLSQAKRSTQSEGNCFLDITCQGFLSVFYYFQMKRKTLIFVMCLRIRNITRLSLPSAFKKYGMALCSNIITDIMEHQVSALFSNERCQFSNLAITTLLIIEK